MTAWAVAGLMLLVALLETASQTLFKSAVQGIDMPTVSLRTMLALAWRLLRSLRVWAGMWIGLATIALWTWSLSLADLNLVFGLSSLHYILVALSSRFILGEHLGAWRIAGVGLVTSGVAVIGFTGG